MTIADTLHDAIADIDAYLQAGADVSGNNLEMWVMNVRDSMELLRCRLDTDLQGNQPPFRIYTDPEDGDDDDR